MQFMAILDQHEIIFVDSQSYAVSGDTGGRMILLAWQYGKIERDSLEEPVACKVVSYEHDNKEIQIRLVLEFRQAMKLINERYRNGLPVGNGINIVRL